jgi:NADH dehydrogenase/NADH:ubiquinone oxidoreductase subunit G
MLPGSKVVLDSPFDVLALSVWSKLAGGEMRSDLSSIDRAEGIILLGADVCLTHPVLQVRIKNARDAGAYVLAICEGVTANERLIDLHIETRDHKGVLLALMHGLGIDGGKSGDFPGLKGAVDRLKGRKIAVIVGDKVMEEEPVAVLEVAWKLCKCSGNDGGFIPLLYGNSRGIFETLTRSGIVPSQSHCDAKVVVASSGRASVPDDAKFLFLFDAFESKLAKKCSVFLPCAGLPEDEGTITSLDGRRCSIRPIADPPAMAKQDWEVLSLLRMSLEGKGAGAMARDVLDALSKELEILPRATVKVEPVPIVVHKEKGKWSRQFYRGADIVELVDDLRVLYKYRGVIE